jgi:hypothetical protein
VKTSKGDLLSYKCPPSSESYKNDLSNITFSVNQIKPQLHTKIEMGMNNCYVAVAVKNV